jgi:alpha-beta hydrolase superfamily lysophospholipase
VVRVYVHNAMSTDDPAGGAAKGTIVLIHGLWLSARSWEHWVDRYAEAGYRVLSPGWPGMDVEVEVLRKDPTVMNGLGVVEVADHYETFLRSLDAPPILMGHSLGGLLVQILLDRGLGSVGVAIHPAPPKGVLRLPVSAVRSSAPVRSKPGNRNRTVSLTPKQWHYAFTNTLSEKESKAAYARYHVPAPGRPLFQVATANIKPGAATKVNFGNDDRAPLLLIAGGADHTIPAAMVRENLKRYRRSMAVTDLEEYPGRSHFTTGSPGWEEVADYALGWAEQHQDPAPGR